MKVECKAWTAGRIGYQTDKGVLQANAAVMMGEGTSSFVVFKNKALLRSNYLLEPKHKVLEL